MHGHGDKPFLCTHDGCERGIPGNGFPRHWNLRDHEKRVHSVQANTSRSRSGSRSCTPPPPPHKAVYHPSEPAPRTTTASSTDGLQTVQLREKVEKLVGEVFAQNMSLSAFQKAQDKLAAANQIQATSDVEILNLKDESMKLQEHVGELKKDFDQLSKVQAESGPLEVSMRRGPSEKCALLAKGIVSCLNLSFIDHLVQGIQSARNQELSGISDADSDQTSHSSSSDGQSQRPSSQNLTTFTTPVTSGTKRGIIREGDPPEDENNEGDRDRKRLKAGHTKRLQTNRPFACPFRKNDSAKYSYNNLKYKTCVTTSWRDISHLKLVDIPVIISSLMSDREHISRVHKARCTGCNVFMKSGEELRSHEHCSSSPDTQCTAVDGISEETIERLKLLKATSNGRQNSWEIIYTNIFPVTSPIPEPCRL
jgi:hypothetical protein